MLAATPCQHQMGAACDRQGGATGWLLTMAPAYGTCMCMQLHAALVGCRGVRHTATLLYAPVSAQTPPDALCGMSPTVPRLVLPCSPGLAWPCLPSLVSCRPRCSLDHRSDATHRLMYTRHGTGACSVLYDQAEPERQRWHVRGHVEWCPYSCSIPGAAQMAAQISQ
jgi:hypothetical protein